ncbi:MAG: hypothetical protein ACPGXY_06520 [Alphaproteobacteria bacterium]
MYKIFIFSLSLCLTAELASATYSATNGEFNEEEALAKAIRLSMLVQQPVATPKPAATEMTEEDQIAAALALSLMTAEPEKPAEIMMVEAEEKGANSNVMANANSNATVNAPGEEPLNLYLKNSLKEYGIEDYINVPEEGPWTWEKICVAANVQPEGWEYPIDMGDVISRKECQSVEETVKEAGLEFHHIALGKAEITRRLKSEYEFAVKRRDAKRREAEKAAAANSNNPISKEKILEARELERKRQALIERHNTSLETITQWKEGIKKDIIGEMMAAKHKYGRYLTQPDKTVYQMTYQELCLAFTESSMRVASYMRGQNGEDLKKIYKELFPDFVFNSNEFDKELASIKKHGHRAARTYGHLNHNAINADTVRIRMLQNLYMMLMHASTISPEDQRALLIANQGNACSMGLEGRMTDMILSIIEGKINNELKKI